MSSNESTILPPTAPRILLRVRRPTKKRNFSSAPDLIRLSSKRVKFSENDLIRQWSTVVSLSTSDEAHHTPLRPIRENSTGAPIKPIVFRKVTEWKGDTIDGYLRVVDVAWREERIDEEDARCKRRKMGLFAETSRTVLESEFWAKEALLDEETVRLIDGSLTALHNQGGGAIVPHLSFVQCDSRLGFERDTLRGRHVINRRFSGMEDGEGKGFTVLHYAAMWGDHSGIMAAIEIGADPTVVDEFGARPSAVAKANGHEGAWTLLLEAEARFEESNVDGDCYYEVCRGSLPREVKLPHTNGSQSPYASSFTMSEGEATNSPPDLIRMEGHCTSEEGDGHPALMELQNGFGFWNEQGELILEAGGREDSAASSIDLLANDEDLSSEGRSVDYPDDISRDDEDGDMQEENSRVFDFDNLGFDSDDYNDADANAYKCDSDEDSDVCWKLDFRNRLVAVRGTGSNSDHENETDAGERFRGFGTVTQRSMHGCEYSGGTSDGDSDEEYAGPMLG